LIGSIIFEISWQPI